MKNLLLVSDANVFIDIENANLTEAMFHLPYQFVVPDVLFEEELKQRHEHLFFAGLKQKSLKPAYVQLVLKLTQKYRKASRNDLFALCLAKQESCNLLTGDKPLRKAAEKEGVFCYGTIWLVCQMVTQGILTVEEARQSFKQMKDSGSRLPWQVVEAQLSKLEKKFLEENEIY